MYLLYYEIGGYLLWHWIILGSVMLFSAIYDAFFQRIIISICMIEIIIALFIQLCGGEKMSTLLQGLIPGALILIMGLITNECIGYGDGLMILMIGWSVGLMKTVFIIAVAALFSALVSLVLLLLKKVKRKTRIAFAPFLLVGFLGAGIIK